MIIQMKFFLVTLLFLNLLTVVTPKALDTFIPYSKLKKGKGVGYITKFSFDIGIGEINVRMKFSQPLIRSDLDQVTYLSLVIVPDDKWEEFNEIKECTKKIEAARFWPNIKIPNNGTWSEYVQQSIAQIVRR